MKKKLTLESEPTSFLNSIVLKIDSNNFNKIIYDIYIFKFINTLVPI
jgi:hypothetical protein